MKLLIDSLSTVNQVQKALASLDDKQKIIEIVESLSNKIENEEIYQFLEMELWQLPEELIADNLVFIFELKKSHFQSARDLATNVLNDLSSRCLAQNFTNLIELVRSPYFFVRDEATRLLDKINAKHLFGYFDNIVALRNDPDVDLRHLYKKLVIKMAKDWPIEVVSSYASYVAELQKETDPDLREMGDLLMLRIMETWGFNYDRFKMLLPFFQKCNDYNNVEINEKAAWFSWRILSEAPITDRFINLNYLTKFNNFGDKIIRRMYRTLALDTMEILDEYQLASFSHFLIDCLESSNKDDCSKAWVFLLKIDPDKLPLDYLLYKCDSDFWFVKYKYRFLVKQMSDQFLADQLETLFSSLRSVSRKIRNRSWRLLNRIHPMYLGKKLDYLEEQAMVKNIYVREVAKALLKSI